MLQLTIRSATHVLHLSGFILQRNWDTSKPPFTLSPKRGSKRCQSEDAALLNGEPTPPNTGGAGMGRHLHRYENVATELSWI